VPVNSTCRVVRNCVWTFYIIYQKMLSVSSSAICYWFFVEVFSLHLTCHGLLGLRQKLLTLLSFYCPYKDYAASVCMRVSVPRDAYASAVLAVQTMSICLTDA